jgi:hypothetical protein
MVIHWNMKITIETERLILREILLPMLKECFFGFKSNVHSIVNNMLFNSTVNGLYRKTPD